MAGPPNVARGPGKLSPFPPLDEPACSSTSANAYITTAVDILLLVQSSPSKWQVYDYIKVKSSKSRWNNTCMILYMYTDMKAFGTLHSAVESF